MSSISKTDIQITIGDRVIEGEISKHLAPMIVNQIIEKKRLSGPIVKIKDLLIYSPLGIVAGMHKPKKSFNIFFRSGILRTEFKKYTSFEEWEYQYFYHLSLSIQNHQRTLFVLIRSEYIGQYKSLDYKRGLLQKLEQISWFGFI